MTPQTEFPSPPGGHVGLLTYDSVSKKWYAVLGDGDGHIQIEVTAIALPTGAATAAKQLPAGHDVTIDNTDIAVTGAFFQVTQPVSVASLPLPNGAATAANQLPAGHDVTIDNTFVTVKQTTPADLVVAQHQYDGAAWRMSNLIWGYHERWAESVSFTVTVGGTNYLQTAAVPEGYVYVVGAITSQNNTTLGNREHHLVGGGVTAQLIRTLAVAAGVWQIQFPVNQVLKKDDYVQAQFESCAVDDIIRLRVWGYKMKVNM